MAHKVAFNVTYNQDEFEDAAPLVESGVLVRYWQGAGSVFVMALSPQAAAQALRDAADTIEHAGHTAEDAARMA